MAQGMNYEMIPKLEASIQNLEETMIPTIMKGLEGTEEVVNEAGSDKLKKSYEATSNGVMECVAAFKEQIEVLKNVVMQYKKVQNTIG